MSSATAGRRLDDPNDPVRLSIASALRRNKRVIPVLVGSAGMPTEHALPTDIGQLCRRQAVELRDASWDPDVERLIAAIQSRKAAPARAPSRPAAARRNLAVVLGALGILLVASIAVLVRSSSPAWPPPPVRIAAQSTMIGRQDIGPLAALPGNRIASQDRDKITIWDIATGEREPLYEERGLSSMAALPDGRLALAFWGYIKLLNTQTRQAEETINLHDPYGDVTDTDIYRLVLLEDSMLLSFSTVSVGFCDLKRHVGHVVPMNASDHFAPLSGGRVALLPRDGGIGVWNNRDQNPEVRLPGDAESSQEQDIVALSDREFLTASSYGALTVWSLDTGKQKTVRPAEEGGIRVDEQLLRLPDGSVAELRSDSIQLWTLPIRERPEKSQRFERRNANYMADPMLLPDGRLVLPREDGAVLVWSFETNGPELLLDGHTKRVKHLLLLDEHRLASASEDRTIRIWNLPPRSNRKAAGRSQ